jgi:hypothetical protein
MSNTSNNNGGGGIGFVGLLTIVFIVLRLIPSGSGHIINWSWWWVLSPIWISVLVVIAVLGIAFLFIAIAALLNGGKQ